MCPIVSPSLTDASNNLIIDPGCPSLPSPLIRTQSLCKDHLPGVQFAGSNPHLNIYIGLISVFPDIYSPR